MTGPALPDPAAGSRLARLLVAVYAVLVVHASLYPFSGWQDSGSTPWFFVAAPWPRHATAFDAMLNILGYLPIGFFCVLALYPGIHGKRAAMWATLSALLLSLAMEATQSFLPSRVASNLDVLCNVAGALAGAWLGVVYAPRLLEGGPLRRLRMRYLQPGAESDVGLVLLALWLFTQLNPATLLFGAGDLRNLLAPAMGSSYEPRLFISIEAITAAANLVAALLLASAIANPGRPAAMLLLGVLVAALCVKTAAFAIIMRAEYVLVWLTPGAQLGLLAGLATTVLALRIPRNARLVLAALLLMAGTAVVNLAPANPYLGAILKVWQQGHFLNFNGLTRVVTVVWPFAALGFLMWLALRRGRNALG